MDESKKIRRRDFAALLGAGALVACDDSGGDTEDSVVDEPIAQVGDLAVGAVVDFAYPETRHAAFLVKLGAPAEGGIGPEGDIVAFHRACPHMGCPIPEVDAARGRLGPCPCHLSVFDLKRGGLQVRGRATQNLVQVELEVLPDGSVCAVGLSGLPYGDALRESDT